MTTDTTPPSGSGQGSPADPLATVARQALHVTVGLAVLGVQQFQANRPSLEADLEALGLPALATATNRVGRFLDGQVARLLRPSAGRG